MTIAATMVRHLADYATKSAESLDATREIALSALRYTAGSPNPTIAAAGAWLAIINEVENELPGFKRLLLEAMTEDAKA